MDNLNFNFNIRMDEDFFGSLHMNRNRKILNQLFDEEFENHNYNGDDEENQQQKSRKHQKPEGKVETLLSHHQLQQQQNNATQITWTTIIAKVVTAYNLQSTNKQIKPYSGKVGLALLSYSSNINNLNHGNHNNGGAVNCKLILYKSKNQILESLPLNSYEKQLYKQKGRYLQFLASKQEYWVILRFENEYDENEFHEKLLSHDCKVYEESNCNKAEGGNNVNTESNCNIQKSQMKKREDDVRNNKASAKQTLIRRMAEMGRHLPQLNAIPSSSPSPSKEIITDVSDTETIQIHPTNLNKPLIQPRSNKYTVPYQINKEIVANGKLEPTSMPSTSTTSAYAAPLIMPNIEAQYIPMLFTEQRTQNTELRWSVNKLEQKIEKVLDKLEKLEVKKSGHQYHKVDHYRKDQDDIIIDLEEKIVQLKKENRHLNSILEDSNKPQRIRIDNEKEEEGKCENIIKSLLSDFIKENSRFLQEQNIHVSANMNLKAFLNELIESHQELNKKYKLNQDVIEQETTQRITERERENNKLTEMELKLELMTLKDNNLHLKSQQQKCTEQLKEN